MWIHRLIQCLIISTVIVVASPLPAQEHDEVTDPSLIARPDLKSVLGSEVPDVTLIDEHGRTLRLHSLRGAPLLISPIFTSCPSACPAITASLRAAAAGIDGLGETWNILSVSFDPEDTGEDLAAFREAEDLPPQWILATAAPGQLAALLGALDFRTITLAAGGFAHPSAVAVLDPDMRVSGYLYGLHYETNEVRRVLTTAWARGSLVQKYRPWIVLSAVAGALVLVVVIAATRGRRGTPATG